MKQSAVITKVTAGSIGAEIGICPGDKILSVNGEAVNDLIALSFALADENVEVLVEKADGSQELFEIEKDYDEDLGLEFESAVFDQIRQCANRCLFCFVDQMPSGLRSSLYIKDDDYRLSFLYGNFVTLTNLTKADLARIRRLHLSPLYVSVHATDPDVRVRLLGNPKAANILGQLRELADSGIEMHTQVVLCPQFNDGPILEKTLAQLYELYPAVQSLAIVPVGLTRYREGCHPLRGFSDEEADKVIRTVEEWQRRARAKHDTGFVYLADEFYIAAGHPIPDYGSYDGFPQLENGVGLVRCFLEEWHEAANFVAAGYPNEIWLDVVCGVSAAKILEPLLANLPVANLHVRVVPVENRFFGSNVTVTGLLTGRDICDALLAVGGERSGVILPGVALRKGENIFLDDLTPAAISAELGVPVRVAYSGGELATLLADWGRES